LFSRFVSGRAAQDKESVTFATGMYASVENAFYKSRVVDIPLSLILNAYSSPCNNLHPFSCSTGDIGSTHRTITADGDRWPSNKFIERND
jgi:hypothetical protein